MNKATFTLTLVVSLMLSLTGCGASRTKEISDAVAACQAPYNNGPGFVNARAMLSIEDGVSPSRLNNFEYPTEIQLWQYRQYLDGRYACSRSGIEELGRVVGSSEPRFVELKQAVSNQRHLDAEFLRGRMTYAAYLTEGLAILKGAERNTAHLLQLIKASEDRATAAANAEQQRIWSEMREKNQKVLSGWNTDLGTITPYTPKNTQNSNGVVQCKSFSSNEVRSFQGYCPAGYMGI